MRLWHYSIKQMCSCKVDVSVDYSLKHGPKSMVNVPIRVTTLISYCITINLHYLTVYAHSTF